MVESAMDRVCAAVAVATGYQPRGDRNREARCPAHTDQRASLSITEGTDGRVLLNCHAGCPLDAILAAIGLRTADLFDKPLEPSNGDAKPKIVATYDYVDEAGTLLYQAVRYQPKSFRQRRPDGTGGWTWSLGDTRRVIYRLPKVIEAVATKQPVWIVEGEKDVEALERAGQVATCNSGGAEQWRTYLAEPIHGAYEVIIVRDKDPAGMKWAANVEASLVGKVESIQIVEAHVGKDAADHLGAGCTLDDFELVNPPVEDAPRPGMFIDWGTFWAKDRREAEWLYENFLARGRGHSVYAGHKVGKSLFTLYVCAKLATSGTVVVYLDYEMSEEDLYERLEDMGYGPDTDLSLLRYALLPSIQPLDTAVGAAELLDLVDTVQAAHPDRHVAVVIDTTGRAVMGEENSADTIRNFYRHTGLGLKQRGVTWARLDHAGKDAAKGQRGSSAKGDDVDVVWKLSRTEGGVELRREASRIGWVPEQVAFHQIHEPLRFVHVANAWPAGTKEMAVLLDRLGVPTSAGTRPAGKALRDAGHQGGQYLVQAAQKYRRKALEESQQ